MSETLTLYKLMILYMLDKVDFPLTTAQISEFFLEKGYTTYFKLQDALSELLELGFIEAESTHSRTLYHLTTRGTENISILRDSLSAPIRKDINDFFRERSYDLKSEASVRADYYLTPAREYEVRCRITEDGTDLIDLRLVVPTETEAKTISASWTRHSQKVYASLLSQLL